MHAIPQANEHFEPGNSPIAFGDWNASNALAVGVLAAYANALKTGEGDKVTTSLYHVGTWGMTAALVAQQQGCDYPKDRMMAKCPTYNSYVSADGIWFLMCFGHYNRYCKLVFETLEMDSKYWSDPEYNNLETLAQNGNYVEVTAAIHKACMKWPYAELEKRFRENANNVARMSHTCFVLSQRLRELIQGDVFACILSKRRFDTSYNER